ncbi:MAG TPA: DinB family protein [Terriglobales bacterium]|nr:DinB family protein [Terriglobales bacterium]
MTTASAVPTAAEMAAAIANLERSREAVLAHCAGLADGAWERSDGPGRWSAADILEHLVIVERRSLGLLASMLEQPPEPDWQERTAGREAMLPRAAVAEEKIVAPPPLQPQRGSTPPALLADFAAARAATLAFAATPNQPLKEHTRKHPVLGTLNGYHWLLLIGYHTQRHLSQMRGCA